MFSILCSRSITTTKITTTTTSKTNLVINFFFRFFSIVSYIMIHIYVCFYISHSLLTQDVIWTSIQRFFNVMDVKWTSKQHLYIHHDISMDLRRSSSFSFCSLRSLLAKVVKICNHCLLRT